MSDQGFLHSKPQFGRVPEKCMHDLAITDGAIRLFAHMVWRYGQNQRNFEGRESMAAFMGVSQMTITKRIQELEAADWVVVIERGQNEKTGNYQTLFYHVFLSQQEAIEFRELHTPNDGETIRPKPASRARKLRAGIGGKATHRDNSSIHGGDNSSIRRHANLSLLHPVYLSYLKLYAWYLDTALYIEREEQKKLLSPRDKALAAFNENPIAATLLGLFGNGTPPANLTTASLESYTAAAHDLSLVSATPDKVRLAHQRLTEKAKLGNWTDFGLTAFLKHYPQLVNSENKKPLSAGDWQITPAPALPDVGLTLEDRQQMVESTRKQRIGGI